MEQDGENDNDSFDWEFEGPDADGFLWIHSYGVSINLGPAEEAWTRIVNEMAQRDFKE